MSENNDEYPKKNWMKWVWIGDEADRAERVRDKFWTTLRKAAKKIPFLRDLVAAYFCAFDPATPDRVRWMLLAALAYFVMPFDMIPDFLFGFGFGDDATILLGVISQVRSYMTPEHFAAADEALNDAFDD